MSTHAVLRRTIKALCAPAVIAMLGGHVQVAQAEVIANNTFYSYAPQGSSSTTTLFLNVLAQDLGGEASGPLVEGEPRPLQLVSADLDPELSDISPTVGTDRNCLVINIPPSTSQSGTGRFSIVYTVTDGSSQERSTGTIDFAPGVRDSFTPAQGTGCEDPQVGSSDPAIIAFEGKPIPNDGNLAVADRDFAAGESVTLDGSQTLFFGEVPPTSFQWFVGDSSTPQQQGPSATFTTKLPDGISQVRLVALFEGEGTLRAFSSVTITVAPPTQQNQAIIAFNGMPIADGGELAVADSDAAAGESVTFDGSQSILASEGPRSFQWFVNDILQPNATSSTFTTQLPDGPSQVALVVSAVGPDRESRISVSSEVNVTVAAPQPNAAIIAVNGSPVATGASFAIDDTDNALGETAIFDGSKTVLGDQIPPNRFQWFVNDQLQQDGESPTFQFKLNDGASQVTLIATANDGDFEFARATSTINLTVAAAAVTPSLAMILVNGTPVTNGGTFSLTDTDDTLGETANFDGSQTTLAGGGRPTRFQWFVNDALQQDSESPLFQIRLDENTTSVVRLTATDGQSTATSVANVAVALTLANLPNLTPNQRSVAQALDNICTQLAQRAAANPESLTDNQEDLQDRCRGILAAGTSDQVRALDELGAQDFNGARLQTLLFTNSLYAGVMDRLMALRGGVKGLSLAGLNLVIDGKSVPLAELERMFGQMLGAGAAADEPGSLLGDKWGAWSRGNFTFGDKDRSRNDNGFDADQFSLTAGLDYRLSDKMVIGGALAYGSSNLSYNPNDEGGLDTESWAVSLYGSRYAGKSFYFDALINAANSSYEAHRRISYSEAAFDAGGNVIGTQTVQRDARGDTDGLTLSGGLSGGYDFIYKGFTISPNAGVFYVDSKIDQFREGGSRGLNLIYDEQTFQSLTGTFGLRVNYAWNVPWGVLVPYFRSDYVREFKNDVEAFNVRFASDPADPAPPIVVQSDDPDQSYVRLVGGISGQFPFGISGYVEYQRLQSFEFVDFNDLSMGLRVQYRY